jgi:hypothetical protein
VRRHTWQILPILDKSLANIANDVKRACRYILSSVLPFPANHAAPDPVPTDQADRSVRAPRCQTHSRQDADKIRVAQGQFTDMAETGDRRHIKQPQQHCCGNNGHQA